MYHYTLASLNHKSFRRLQEIYTQIGCRTEIVDRRRKAAWVQAILIHQSSQLEKIADTTEVKAKVENATDTKLDAETEVKELTTVEISSFDYEIYADSKLIASITHDDNHLTQRWVVMINNKEVYRAATQMLCHRYICIHYKDGSLPVQEQEATPHTTENRIMAHIFNECQKYGFEILDDGISQNDVKLGEVGCTNGNWWVKKGSSGQQQYSNSVFDAVRRLCPSQTSLAAEPTPESLQYRSLEQLSSMELQRLLDAEVADCEQLLDLSFDELTSEGWERLRGYEPHLELVAA
ncbi:hypothetical protein [Komarekiella delphini-convector]|uniref:hypothetical protein n=1 Tax=Komarekiella delphini-convector TaxID=3050158 RepID=UPI00177D1022|nr:hypothetical protein [Komarekiella delphini-convector]